MAGMKLLVIICVAAVNSQPDVNPTPDKCNNVDVVLLIDSTMTFDEFDMVRKATFEIAQELERRIDDNRMAVVHMTGEAPTTEFDLLNNTTPAELIAALSRMTHRPGKHLGQEALIFVEQNIFTEVNGDRDAAKNYVIYVAKSPSESDPSEPAARMKTAGVGFISMGVQLGKNDLARNQLMDLSGPERFIEFPTFNEREKDPQFAKKVADFLCANKVDNM